MKNNRDIISDLIDRTEMYIPNPTYAAVVAFLVGCEYAFDGDFLEGFDAWVESQTPQSKNVHWSGQILDLAFPGNPLPQKELLHPEGDKSALQELKKKINEYFRIL